MIHIHPELADAVELGVIQARGVSIRKAPHEFSGLHEDMARDCARRYANIPPRKIEAVQAARKLFHRAGLDPTRYRPSSESLLRRAVREKPFYFINTAVDLINYYSFKLLIPMGLFDSDRIVPPIEFRVGQEGETYEGIGRSALNLYHFPLLSDREGPFGSPVSDSVRTQVRTDTRNLLWVTFAPLKTDVPLEEMAARLVEWNGGTSETLQGRD